MCVQVDPLTPKVTCVKSTQGPSWGYLKVNDSETLSFFGDECPQNGSNNEPMAPTTNLECPHEGPRVVYADMVSVAHDPLLREWVETLQIARGLEHWNPAAFNKHIRRARYKLWDAPVLTQDALPDVTFL